MKSLRAETSAWGFALVTPEFPPMPITVSLIPFNANKAKQMMNICQVLEILVVKPVAQLINGGVALSGMWQGK